MQPNEQCGFLDRRIETFDPENLLEVIRDGRFDHRLLEGGSFEVRHRRIVFGNSSVDCGDYSPAFAVNGQFSSDQICLGFTPQVEKPAFCNGFSVAQGEILCFTEGAELQFRNAPRTTWQALLIDRHELQEVATILTGRPLELPERGTANFKAPDRASSLTSVIQAALSDLADSGALSGLAPANLCEEIVNEFIPPLRALTRLLTRAREISPDTALRLCGVLKNFLESAWMFLSAAAGCVVRPG